MILVITSNSHVLSLFFLYFIVVKMDGISDKHSNLYAYVSNDSVLIRHTVISSSRLISCPSCVTVHYGNTCIPFS
jgi:hypothetical protein